MPQNALDSGRAERRGVSAGVVHTRVHAGHQRFLAGSVNRLLLIADAEFGQKPAKDSAIHWFDQMGVETSFLGPAAGILLPPPRQRHQEWPALLALLLTNSTSRLVPVEHRQTDVQKDDVGIKRGCCFHSRQAVMLGKCLVAGELEQHGEHVC